MCPYYNAAKEAADAKMFLANTSILSSAIAPKGDAAKRDLLIIDEAHLLEDFLMDVGTIRFSADRMIKLFEAEKRLDKEDLRFIKSIDLESSSKPTTKMEKYINICKSLSENIYKDMVTYEAEQNKRVRENDVKKVIDRGAEKKSNKFKHKREILETVTKLEAYEKSDPTDSWVYNWNKKDRSLEIVPVNVDWIFKKYFDKLADKIIFMSATILNFSNFTSSIGIRPDQCCFVDVDSTFDPKNAPIINIGNCKTNYHDLQDSANMDTIVKTVKFILDKHKGQRGIIHTGNMKISKYIKEHLHDTRLLVRLDEVRNEDILEEHMVSSDTVLVSSSLTEGIDLHDDLSQFQIIVKLPWDSLGNVRTKTLADEVPLWYQNKMWQKLLQASGRSVRSQTDYAETFILDSTFDFQHKKFSKYLPEYFEKRLVNP
jgi:Rad3-related DNA helicase